MALSTKLRDTIKYPTSLIIRGADPVGVELAKALLEQGGFVIMVDHDDEYSREAIAELKKYDIFLFVDFLQIYQFEEELRRLDYVFYLNHSIDSLDSKISSQEFLEFSKFIDTILALSTKFEAKFLATTSIKAHQFLLNQKELDIKLDSSSELHTVYTDAEIQRYTESLTLEYIQKKSLDARIIRLGELVGEDVPIDPNTTVGRLVREAVYSTSLTLYGDGLDSEYYVHLYDAIYGIIKSQFTKNTRGEVFSLCYEHEISALSIAYKLNEYADQPKEIDFSNEDDPSSLNIRLYKAAPNLMRIGWKPRISFERALKQSYDMLYEYFESQLKYASDVEEYNLSQEGKIEHKGGFLSRLFGGKKDSYYSSEVENSNEQNEQRDNFENQEEYDEGISDNEKNQQNAQRKLPKKDIQETVQEELDGALGRLISERKAQEEGRRGSIVMANEYLMKRMKKQNQKKSIPQKINTSITKSFDRFTRRFDTFRFMTIRQFVFLLILLIGFGYLYIVYLSPAISFGKNIFLSYRGMVKATENLSNNEYDFLSDNIDYADKYLEFSKDDLKSLEDLKFWDAYQSIDEEFSKISLGMRKLNQGVSIFNQNSESLFEYLNKWDPEIIYREDARSLLTVQQTTDSSEFISNMEDKNKLFEEGIEYIEEADKEFLDINLAKISLDQSTIEEDLNSFITGVEGFMLNYKSYNQVNTLLPQIFSTNEEINYVFILTDSTAYMPVGGKPIAVMIASFVNGSLNQVSVKPIDLNEYKVENPSGYLINQINLVDDQIIDNQTITFEDLFLLQQGDIYMKEISTIIASVEELKVDGLFIVDLNFLSNLLKIIDYVEFQDITFKSDNFQKNFDLVVQASPTDNIEEYKKQVLTHIFAKTVRGVFNSMGTEITEFTSIMEDVMRNKYLVYKIFDNYELNRLENSDNVNRQNPDYIDLMLVSDTTKKQTLHSPRVEMDVDVLIRKDKSTRKTIQINADDTLNLEAIVVCLPLGTSNFEYSESNDSSNFLRISESNTCVRMNIDTNKSISLSYDTVSMSYLDSDYTYSLGIGKQLGSEVDYKVTFTTDDGEFTDSSNGEVSGKKAEFEGKMESDLIFELDID